MKLTDTKKLLNDNGFKYIERIVPSRAEFYRQKGFNPSEDAGPFVLISIPNPNHQIDIQLVFSDTTDNPDFNDLEFGGYWYELFDCEETYVAQELLTEIHNIQERIEAKERTHRAIAEDWIAQAEAYFADIEQLRSNQIVHL